MPKRAEDITDDIIYDTALAIRMADTTDAATEILIAFCERYRKNSTTVRDRVKHIANKEYYNEHSKKWWDKHKEEYNKKRNAKAKAKREQRKLEEANNEN